jgi:hypothetical protein
VRLRGEFGKSIIDADKRGREGGGGGRFIHEKLTTTYNGLPYMNKRDGLVLTV